MSTITIYTETHRDAVLYGATEKDADLYDDKIIEYFNYLQNEAKEAGHEIEFADQLSGQSYTVDNDDESGHDFMQWEIQDFWSWYN